MCVAALVKPDGKVSDEDMHRMFSANRDGAGLAYVKTVNKTPEVVIAKGYYTSTAWIEALRKAEKSKDADSPIILHARIATQGKVSTANCHPFKVKDGAVIHNGTLWYGGTRDMEKSDTREFAERMHNIMVHDDLAFDKRKIERQLGTNKLVLLFKDKRYLILNEEAGSWRNDGGMWVSNCYWISRKPEPCVAYIIPDEAKKK